MQEDLGLEMEDPRDALAPLPQKMRKGSAKKGAVSPVISKVISQRTVQTRRKLRILKDTRQSWKIAIAKATLKLPENLSA